MSIDQTAIISDVHGNIWAFKSILEDIEKKDIKYILNLGDSLYGPLKPCETADLIIELNIPSVRGNEDRILTETYENVEDSPSLNYVKSCLREKHITWLKSLEPTLIFDTDFFLCHGTPENDMEYLLQNVTKTGVVQREANEIMEMLSDINRKVILCGHDHIQNTKKLPDGKIIVNPGSVGLPAYTDFMPFPHKMQAGTPHARYCIISKTENDYKVKNIRVKYDWDTASKSAETNGRPDWTAWLKTGKV